MSVTFAPGDQFGARAKANGEVEVFKNGVLLGIRSVTAWPFYPQGGYIGLFGVNANQFVLDDFGGGGVDGLHTNCYADGNANLYTPHGHTNTHQHANGRSRLLVGRQPKQRLE